MSRAYFAIAARRAGPWKCFRYRFFCVSCFCPRGFCTRFLYVPLCELNHPLPSAAAASLVPWNNKRAFHFVHICFSFLNGLRFTGDVILYRHKARSNCIANPPRNFQSRICIEMFVISGSIQDAFETMGFVFNLS